jgi:hypothetical protein
MLIGWGQPWIVNDLEQLPSRMISCSVIKGQMTKRLNMQTSNMHFCSGKRDLVKKDSSMHPGNRALASTFKKKASKPFFYVLKSGFHCLRSLFFFPLLRVRSLPYPHLLT